LQVGVAEGAIEICRKSGELVSSEAQEAAAIQVQAG
jgi:hypothetical protein